MPRKKEFTISREIRLTEDMWKKIEDVRFLLRCESKADAVRLLLEYGLESAGKAQNEQEKKKSFS